MGVQEIVYLDLNEEEKKLNNSYSEMKHRKSTFDYERYLSEEDDLVIETINENQIRSIESYETRMCAGKSNFYEKKVRLPCHITETVEFCKNVCNFRKFCSHKK
ncbi:MAG: hypothetical protein ACLFPQ_00700 [Candidatus Woesearchaeota archaeon]